MTSPNTIIADLVAEVEMLKMQRDELSEDAMRYRWLRDRLIGADFDWNESGACVLVFEWPETVPVGGSCDMNIDAAIENEKGESC